MDEKEVCGVCKFLVSDDKPGSNMGVCTRFPQTVSKYHWESCGEFKPKITKEVLREGKKDETSS